MVFPAGSWSASKASIMHGVSPTPPPVGLSPESDKMTGGPASADLPGDAAENPGRRCYCPALLPRCALNVQSLGAPMLM